MPEGDGSLLTILSATSVVLLVVILALMIRISSRVGRLERLGGQGNPVPGTVEEKAAGAESTSGGAFELFLSEDPARRELSKAEQFSAYRIWRQEKGLNWSNS